MEDKKGNNQTNQLADPRAISKMTRASAVVARFIGSYGCMTTVLSFFTLLDSLKLQVLSKWWYKVGVGRIQT